MSRGVTCGRGATTRGAKKIVKVNVKVEVIDGDVSCECVIDGGGGGVMGGR